MLRGNIAAGKQSVSEQLKVSKMDLVTPPVFLRNTVTEPPLMEEQTVYINSSSGIKAIVKRDEYRRNIKFRLHDHIYRLLFQKDDPATKDPSLFLVSSLQTVQDSVEAILETLKKYYTEKSVNAPDTQEGRLFKQHGHQAWIVCEGRDFGRGAISIGSFDLENEPAKETANEVVTQLYDILTQYTHIKPTLNSAFKIHFRIVNAKVIEPRLQRGFVKNKVTFLNKSITPIEEISKKAKERGFLPDDVEGDSSADDAKEKRPRPPYVLPNPIGFKSAETAFESKCFFTSLVLARAKCRLEGHAGTRHTPSRAVELIGQYIDKPDRPLNIKAGRYILAEIQSLEGTYGSQSSNDDIMDAVSRYWKMNLLVFDEGGKVAAQFPSQINLSQALVFMLLSKNAGGQSHLELIEDMPQYIRKNGFSCIFENCGHASKCFDKRGHLCRSSCAKSCFSCRRYAAEESKILVSERTKSYLFCTKQMGEKEVKCAQCDLVMAESCVGRHKHICKNIGFFCTKCETYVRGQQNLVRKSHRCFVQTCLTCFQPLVEEDGENARSSHMCPLKRVKMRSEIVNMGFIDLDVPLTGNALCIDCFQLEELDPSNSRCKLHPKNQASRDLLPLVATLIYENRRHEDYAAVTFLDPSLSPDELHYPSLCLPAYLPQEFKERYLGDLELSKKKPYVRFKQFARKDVGLEASLNRLNKEKDLDATSLLIKFVCQERFRNFFLLLTDFEQLDLLLRGIIRHGIVPKGVLARNGKTLRFHLPYLGITFACARTFVDKDLHQAGDGGSLTFVPRSVLITEEWKTLEQAPPLNNYFELQDADSLRELKEAYWKKLQGRHFRPLLELVNSSQTAAICLSRILLSYIRDCLDFQLSCLKTWGTPPNVKENELPFLHPMFSATATSHLYESFRLHQSNNGLKVLKKTDEYPSRTKSSFQENEAVLHLQKFETGWRSQFSHGSQVRLCVKEKNSEALRTVHECDAWNEERKELFCYNGCYW